MSAPRPRVGLLATHPIQYYAPWYRALAEAVELTIFYAHRQSGADHARSEFGLAFEWDIPLLEGYAARFLDNRAPRPDVSRWDGCDTPAIGAIIRAGRFDAFIVQGWYVRSYQQAIAACWASRTPLLIRGDSHLLTPRSPLKALAKAAAYRAFIPRFDGYLVVGTRNRDYYRHYGADPRRMFFAPHSVDNRRFAERAAEVRPTRAALRAAWGLPADATVALFAGKLAAHKRPADFVRGLAAAARGAPGLWGLVAGDGPERAELERLAGALGAPLRFAGFLNQSRMPAAYAAADLLAVTSDETWGLVVNEAMACGLPAVVSERVGCAPDLVLAGRSGATFGHGDVAGLAAALAGLAADPARLAELGRGAAKRVAGYTIEQTVEGTLAAIGAVRRQRAGAR